MAIPKEAAQAMVEMTSGAASAANAAEATATRATVASTDRKPLRMIQKPPKTYND
jgi:hypothetical protein